MKEIHDQKENYHLEVCLAASFEGFYLIPVQMSGRLDQ